MVDDAELSNKFLAGSSLFKKVTFRSASSVGANSLKKE
jgi:hypothetical protein